MTRRRHLVLGFAVALMASSAGCYSAHERARDAASEPDGDALLPSDASTPLLEPEPPETVGLLSAARIFPRLLRLGDRIVIAAGAGLTGAEPVPLDVYDPRTGRIAPDPTLPGGPVGAAYFVMPGEDAITFAGGLGFDAELGPSGEPSSAAGRVSAGIIESLEPLPQPSGWPEVAELDGLPLVISGFGRDEDGTLESHDFVQWLDRDGEWRSVDILGRAVTGGRAVARAGEVVVTGGLATPSRSSHANVGRIMGSVDGVGRRGAHRMDQPRAGHAALLHADGTRVIVIGGVNLGRLGPRPSYVESPANAIVEIDDVGSGERPWARLPDLPYPLAFARALTIPTGALVVIGGTSEPLRRARGRSEVLVLEPGGTAWRVIETSLAPRYAHGITMLPDGSVLIAGGLRAPGDPVLEVERLGFR